MRDHPTWQPTAEYAAQVRACEACQSPEPGACSRHHPDDRAKALEGRVLVFASYFQPGVVLRFREPGAFVRGAVRGPRRGEVLALLPGNLGACVPAACAGDLVYLEEEIGRARAAAERREVEAWKASQVPR